MRLPDPSGCHPGASSRSEISGHPGASCDIFGPPGFNLGTWLARRRPDDNNSAVQRGLALPLGQVPRVGIPVLALEPEVGADHVRPRPSRRTLDPSSALSASSRLRGSFLAPSALWPSVYILMSRRWPGLRVAGDDIPVTTPTGRARLHVVGIFQFSAGSRSAARDSPACRSTRRAC